uniref:Uncharacterized protein n=1 Tax=Mycena chlorophos TaxID=658473 RepID=A0ABQ0LRC6_MYCCL|nr:predicted protein [Mycena chlorophos]
MLIRQLVNRLVPISSARSLRRSLNNAAASRSRLKRLEEKLDAERVQLDFRITALEQRLSRLEPVVETVALPVIKKAAATTLPLALAVQSGLHAPAELLLFLQAFGKFIQNSDVASPSSPFLQPSIRHADIFLIIRLLGEYARASLPTHSRGNVSTHEVPIDVFLAKLDEQVRKGADPDWEDLAVLWKLGSKRQDAGMNGLTEAQLKTKMFDLSGITEIENPVLYG